MGKNLKILISVILIFFVFSQNIKSESIFHFGNEKNIIYKNNNKSGPPFILKYQCSNCFGKGVHNRENSKICSNCSYWTNYQKEVNYCSVCRNRRMIITKQWTETCTNCKGKKVLSSNVSDSYYELIRNFTHSGYLDNEYNGKNSIYLNENGRPRVSLVKVFPTDPQLCFKDDRENCYLFFYSNGNVSIRNNGGQMDDNKDFLGKWYIDNNTLKINVTYSWRNTNDFHYSYDFKSNN
jgi:hypothetical protein